MKKLIKAALLISVAAAVGAQEFDLVIQDGRVVDGTGSPWFAADIGITGDRIASIGPLRDARAKRRIRATGLIVAPGFIDMHSHAGGSVRNNPALESLVRQGITTALEGQDGGSPIPLGPALDRLSNTQVSINFGYFAGHNAIRAAEWSLAGGPKALAERLDAPDSRAKIRAEITRRIVEDRGAGDAANIQFASCGFDHTLDGRTLADAVRDRKLDPTPENAADLMIGLQRKGGCSAIYHAISEDDVVRILQSPYTMIGTDGFAPKPGEGSPHPRCYGTFPRVLGRYVGEQKVLTLEEAIRRMTGLPSSRLKLAGRGLLRPGMKADVVIFDADRITDRSGYTKPHQYSEGVEHLIVNGTPVLLNGAITGEFPGRVLYGPAKR